MPTSGNKVSPEACKPSARLLIFLISSFLFGMIAYEAVIEHQKAFDNSVFVAVGSVSTTAFIHFMTVLTFFGSTDFLIPAYVVIIGFFFWKKQFVYGLVILAVAASATEIEEALKLVFHRVRPDHPLLAGVIHFSFPSGHAVGTFVFSGILAYITSMSSLQKRSKSLLYIILACFAFLVALSRITLKVHYPTDIIASWCLGSDCLIVSSWIIGLFQKKSSTATTYLNY